MCTSAPLLKSKVAHNVQHDLDYPGQSELREEKEKEKRQRLAGHHADTGQEQTVGRGCEILIRGHLITP